MTQYAKQKFKWNFDLITYEKLNMKSNEQDYDARLYFKSMLNRLKIMGDHISISTILGT